MHLSRPLDSFGPGIGHAPSQSQSPQAMSGNDLQPHLRQQQAFEGVHELLALHLLPQPEQLRRPDLVLTLQRQ